MGILVIFFNFEISGIHLEEIQIQIGGKCESIDIRVMNVRRFCKMHSFEIRQGFHQLKLFFPFLPLINI